MTLLPLSWTRVYWLLICCLSHLSALTEILFQIQDYICANSIQHSILRTICAVFHVFQPRFDAHTHVLQETLFSCLDDISSRPLWSILNQYQNLIGQNMGPSLLSMASLELWCVACFNSSAVGLTYNWDFTRVWCSRLYYCIDQLSHHKPDPSMMIDRLPALAATFPCGCCVTTPCPIGQYPDCDTSNQTHRLASDNFRET